MKRIISCLLAVSMFASSCFIANATDESNGQESGLIGTQSMEEVTLSENKAEAVARITEIREAYCLNNGNISDDEYEEICDLLDEYYPDASVSDYLPETSTMTRSNPGDYTSDNLWLPGAVQATNYYCGPASGYAVLQGRGISVTQSELASKMGTTTDGTGLYNVAPALNQYNGTNGNSFHYATMAGYQLTGESMTATEWAIKFTNAAITTIMGGYGVIYDVHQVAGSSNYLQGYGTAANGANSSLYHYVAGEGYDSSDPSTRICYYYDSNNQKSNLGNRHMNIKFRTMAVLCNDRGLIY
jgi:hypothetical protein